ncbi:MAG: D-sedoheptulose 7-phosphate isomerase [Parcubacteria group bacterium Gr01-1014_33]|nr:MAG: D-sedoheptulose 7-phosphate isomerase [Parcubacteria group bacterium Gr01-1014_33]
MEIKDKIAARFDENIEVVKTSSQVPEMEEVVQMLVEALRKGNKILVCGNGGSMEQAQHFAGELAGKFKMNRRPLAIIALGTNTDLLTAVANDFDYSEIFARELEAIGKEGDILVALSTSGNSPNVLSALERAKKLGIKTIGLTGAGGKLKELADISLCVASSDTPRIQEVHLIIIHIISELVEETLFS